MLRLDRTGSVDSAATTELVASGAAGTGHGDQVTDCKSLKKIEAQARAARPLKFPDSALLSSARSMQVAQSGGIVLAQRRRMRHGRKMTAVFP